jgi:hypothetical protein
MYQLCWEAVYVNDTHGVWVTRKVDWLHREQHLSVNGVPVTLEVSVRVTANWAECRVN